MGKRDDKPEFLPPQTVFIELTNHCNMHCTFCPSDLLVLRRRHADEEDIRNFLGQIHGLGLRPPVLLNVLGEPLLNKSVYFLLDFLEEYGHPVTLITNMTLLDDPEAARKLLSHDNLTLALSLQTVTRKSFALRGYRRHGLKDLLEIGFRAMEEKFRLGSSAQIELHVASNWVVSHDPTIQSDIPLDLWPNFKNERAERRWIRGFLKKLRTFAGRVRKLYPQHVEQESRFVLEKYKDHIPARVALTPETLPEDFPRLKDEDFWGYMFLPNVLLRFKQLELWKRDPAFLRSVFPVDAFVYVEERLEPRPCSMAANLGMLAGGELVFCCLDYDGGMGVGHVKEKALEDVLSSKERKALLENAMTHPVCRRCKGTVFVFRTDMLRGPAQRVAHFGRGWDVYEPGLYGRGGRWTRGEAAAYIYPRLKTSAIKVSCRTELSSGSPLRMEISVFDGARESFVSETVFSFSLESGKDLDFSAPFDFQEGRLYRIELSSATFIPHDIYNNNDLRRLGLAVFEILLLA